MFSVDRFWPSMENSIRTAVLPDGEAVHFTSPESVCPVETLWVTPRVADGGGGGGVALFAMTTFEAAVADLPSTKIASASNRCGPSDRPRVSMEASYGACCSVECRLPSIEKTTRRTARPLGVATHLWVPVKVTPSQRLCVTQNVLAAWFATVTRAVEVVFVPSVAVAVTVNGNVPLAKRFVSTEVS